MDNLVKTDEYTVLDIDRIVDEVDTSEDNNAIDEMYPERKQRREKTKLDAASREAMKAWIVTKIRAGISHWELMDAISNKWGLQYAQAQKYVNVVRNQLHEDYLKYCDNVAETNVNTLTEIRNQAMNMGQYRVALSAIDLLNKMGNMYENKVDLNVSTDAPIEVSFK